MLKTIAQIAILTLTGACLLAADTNNVDSNPSLPVAGTNIAAALPDIVTLFIDPVNGPIQKIHWEIEGTNVLEGILSTNLQTNWAAISEDPIKGRNTNIVNQRQVGTVITNRMTSFVYKGVTNWLRLDILGAEKKPSQYREVVTQRSKK